MKFEKIKSYAKINLALNVTGKTSLLHKIETIVAFVSLHDEIFIKKIRSKRHIIYFYGRFSKEIGKKNTVSDLLKILEKKKIIKEEKFFIKINKKIPHKAGLGGGSMNAASILRYFIKKKNIKISGKKIKEICRLIGSDVILGYNSTFSILSKKMEVRHFSNCKKFYTLIVKPKFGCSTKDIFKQVSKFNRPKFNKPNKKMFKLDYIKNLNNQLEQIVLSKYPILRSIKLYLENILDPVFVRMTGSGSALVAYFPSKKRCENAKKKFHKKYKNYWCIASKTI